MSLNDLLYSHLIMKKKITILLCTILIINIFCSCASVKSVANKITIESGEIPPDMKSEEFILIGVLKGKRSYDKYVKKEFENYTGRYILALETEIADKYTDINKYRYIMNYKLEHGSIGTYNADNAKYGQSPYGSSTTTGFRYYIIDRQENKEYVRNSRSSFYAKEMRAYLLAVDRVRKK